MTEAVSFFEVIQLYFGDSIIGILFLVAMLYFWKHASNTEKKVSSMVVVTGVLVVFNPVSYYIVVKLGENEAYYRFLWMCPCLLMVAYLIIKNFSHASTVGKKLCMGIICVAVYLYCGGINVLLGWTCPENIYQLDNDVVEIADLMRELSEGQRVVFMDNGTLSNNIRQYDANVLIVESNNDRINQVLCTDKPDFAGAYVRQYVVYNKPDYIAIEKERLETNCVIEAAGLSWTGASENYNLYETKWEEIEVDNNRLAALCDETITLINTEYAIVPELEDEYEFLYVNDLFSDCDEKRVKKVIEIANELMVEAVIINDCANTEMYWTGEIERMLDALQMPYICNAEESQILNYEEFTVCVTNYDRECMEVLKEIREKGHIVLITDEPVGKRLEDGTVEWQDNECEATIADLSNIEKIISKAEGKWQRYIDEELGINELITDEEEDNILTLVRISNGI